MFDPDIELHSSAVWVWTALQNISVQSHLCYEFRISPKEEKSMNSLGMYELTIFPQCVGYFPRKRCSLPYVEHFLLKFKRRTFFRNISTAKQCHSQCSNMVWNVRFYVNINLHCSRTKCETRDALWTSLCIPILKSTPTGIRTRDLRRVKATSWPLDDRRARREAETSTLQTVKGN